MRITVFYSSEYSRAARVQTGQRELVGERERERERDKMKEKQSERAPVSNMPMVKTALSLTHRLAL